MAVLQVYLDENGKQSDHPLIAVCCVCASNARIPVERAQFLQKPHGSPTAAPTLEPFLQSVQRHVADAGEQLQESYVWFRAKRSSTESGMRRA